MRFTPSTHKRAHTHTHTHTHTHAHTHAHDILVSDEHGSLVLHAHKSTHTHTQPRQGLPQDLAQMQAGPGLGLAGAGAGPVESTTRLLLGGPYEELELMYKFAINDRVNHFIVFNAVH